MPLWVNLRHLATRDIVLQGQLTPRDLDLESLDDLIQVTQPASYDLVVTKSNQTVLLEGTVRLVLGCQCVRCLEPFTHVVELNGSVGELALEGDEATPVVNDCVDLTPCLREDMLLAFPPHPLCKPDCRGLQAGPTGDRPNPAGRDAAGNPPAAWVELDKLKF